MRHFLTPPQTFYKSFSEFKATLPKNCPTANLSLLTVGMLDNRLLNNPITRLSCPTSCGPPCGHTIRYVPLRHPWLRGSAATLPKFVRLDCRNFHYYGALAFLLWLWLCLARKSIKSELFSSLLMRHLRCVYSKLSRNPPSHYCLSVRIQSVERNTRISAHSQASLGGHY